VPITAVTTPVARPVRAGKTEEREAKYEATVPKPVRKKQTVLCCRRQLMRPSFVPDG